MKDIWYLTRIFWGIQPGTFSDNFWQLTYEEKPHFKVMRVGGCGFYSLQKKGSQYNVLIRTAAQICAWVCRRHLRSWTLVQVYTLLPHRVGFHSSLHLSWCTNFLERNMNPIHWWTVGELLTPDYNLMSISWPSCEFMVKFLWWERGSQIYKVISDPHSSHPIQSFRNTTCTRDQRSPVSKVLCHLTPYYYVSFFVRFRFLNFLTFMISSNAMLCLDGIMLIPWLQSPRVWLCGPSESKDGIMYHQSIISFTLSPCSPWLLLLSFHSWSPPVSQNRIRPSAQW